MGTLPRLALFLWLVPMVVPPVNDVRPATSLPLSPHLLLGVLIPIFFLMGLAYSLWLPYHHLLLMPFMRYCHQFLFRGSCQCFHHRRGPFIGHYLAHCLKLSPILALLVAATSPTEPMTLKIMGNSPTGVSSLIWLTLFATLFR